MYNLQLSYWSFRVFIFSISNKNPYRKSKHYEIEKNIEVTKRERNTEDYGFTLFGIVFKRIKLELITRKVGLIRKNRYRILYKKRW